MMHLTKLTQRNVRKYVIPLATGLVLLVNFLATTLPLNNRSTGDIADSFPISFIPEGYVFSIWGIIYAGLISFSVLQFISKDQNLQKLIEKLTLPYLISCVNNIAWIFLWHYDFPVLSLVAMTGLLFNVWYIFITIKKYRLNKNVYIPFTLPFTLYFAWITVATIVNITVALYDLGFSELILSADVWSFLLAIVSGIIGALVSYKFKDFAYGGVIIWALFGIIVKFRMISIIVAGGTIGIVIIVCSAGYNLFSRKRFAN